MTNTLTLTHSEATRLQKELNEALNDKNLDTIQIVSTGDDIHVVRCNMEGSNEHPNDSRGH